MVLSSSMGQRVVVRTDKNQGKVLFMPALKPGEAAMRHAAPWSASTLPRAIRNRSPRKAARIGKLNSPTQPGSPHQETAANAVTGKRALGPWLGPFNPDASARGNSGSPTDALLPHTIYMDTCGAAHMGLDAADHLRLVRALQQAQEDNGMLSMHNTRPLEAAAAAATAKVLAVQMMEMRRLQARRVREAGLRAHPALEKAPGAVRGAMRRNRNINQPRRLN